MFSIVFYLLSLFVNFLLLQFFHHLSSMFEFHLDFVVEKYGYGPEFLERIAKNK